MSLTFITFPLTLSEDKHELVIFLIENGYFFKEETDESTILKNSHTKHLSDLSSGKTLVALDLRISEKCNFGCKHCIVGQSEKSKPLMKEQMAIDAVNAFMACSKTGGIDLHFGNAEPFLNFNVLQATYNHLNEHYPDAEKRVSVNTNLSLLNEAKAQFLTQSGITTYVSLDGEKPANDAIRIFKKGGVGTYDVVMEKMSLLEKYGHPIEGISVTATDQNYQFFGPNFIDWCHTRGYTSLGFDFDLINPLSISVDERVEILHSMWIRAEELGMEFFGTWMTPFINITSKSIMQEEYAFCKGIHGRAISIDGDGQIHICGYSDTMLGHFSKLHESIQPGGKLYALVESRLVGNVSHCHGCEIEGACAGQCYATCESSQQKASEQCIFYRKVTKKFLETYAGMEESWHYIIQKGGDNHGFPQAQSSPRCFHAVEASELLLISPWKWMGFSKF